MHKQFNQTLLLLARQYRGRSQESVAEVAGLNQGHYSRIENGLLPEGPSEENVERIASSLGFRPSFFYLSSDVAGLPISVHPMNRKKASVGEKALKSIHAELNVRLIHLRKLLQAVELSAELPLPWIDVDEGGGPPSVARTVRRQWGIPDGPIRNLTELCERAGILVIWCDLDEAVDGVTMRIRDLPTCIFLNKKVSADRMRFSLAHELGHVVMHRYPTDTIEDEANAFAGEFLVPERELKRQLIGRRLTLEVLARQKAYWRVSMNFLILHTSRIGYINKNQAEYLWKQMAVRGWRTHEPDETAFERERPTLFEKVVQLHAQELGYDLSDFSKFLDISETDIHGLYGDILPAGKTRLRVIK